MLKVLLVDDDIPARAKLRTLIDWERQGFVLCGEAENGIAAIKLLAGVEPDIIVTDMNMPVMDGVAFIAYVAHHYPGVKMIALSGYDDFEYVRNSLKSGVVDYMLKHRLNADNMLALLTQTRNGIYREKAELGERVMHELHREMGRKVAVSSFVKRLSTGMIGDRGEIVREALALQIKLDTKNIVVVMAEIDGFSQMQDTYSASELAVLAQTFIDIAIQSMECVGSTIMEQLDNGSFVMLVSLGHVHSELYTYNQLSEAIGSIRQSAARQLNLTACFSVSRKCPDIADISQYCSEAERALADKFYDGKNMVFWHGTVKPRKKAAVFSLSALDERELNRRIRAFDDEGTADYIEALFNKMLEEKDSFKSIQLVSADLINLLHRVAREFGIFIEELYKSDDIPYNQPQKFETIIDIRHWLLDVYASLFAKLKRCPSGRNKSPYGLKAVQYVRQHFRRNISLHDAAVALGINASYLSRLFKDEYCLGFVEYLNKVRVEEAKALIDRAELRVKDIYKEVGFNNYTYFFRVFKDLTGMTPLEYKNRTMSSI
ncbi:response regulator transcription factor [Paenibacillus spongiae]|uniref:Helix-turn-helix domain-containing protein n=1 Tax=Paenibacillus spongiae TaxID=2909671 RepID=A0ABY5S3N1_9BACL|nr:helix-turn-helix domain-containing protein [Paenibacillus spongiae]UVI27445.1 helix-turn-helix domain-containing protein [Paenibacillus spongiae]